MHKLWSYGIMAVLFAFLFLMPNVVAYDSSISPENLFYTSNEIEFEVTFSELKKNKEYTFGVAIPPCTFDDYRCWPWQTNYSFVDFVSLEGDIKGDISCGYSVEKGIAFCNEIKMKHNNSTATMKFKLKDKFRERESESFIVRVKKDEKTVYEKEHTLTLQKAEIELLGPNKIYSNGRVIDFSAQISTNNEFESEPSLVILKVRKDGEDLGFIKFMQKDDEGFWNTNLDTSLMDDGKYFLTSQACAFTLCSYSSEKLLFVDKTFPTIDTNDARIVFPEKQFVIVGFSDNMNLATLYFAFNNNVYREIITSGPNPSYNVTLSLTAYGFVPEEDNYISFRAIDQAGNVTEKRNLIHFIKEEIIDPPEESDPPIIEPPIEPNPPISDTNEPTLPDTNEETIPDENEQTLIKDIPIVIDEEGQLIEPPQDVNEEVYVSEGNLDPVDIYTLIYDSGSVTIRWNESYNPNTKSYELYRATSPSSEGVLIARDNILEFVDPNVSEGRTYYYKVRYLDYNSNYSQFGIIESVFIPITNISPVIKSFETTNVNIFESDAVEFVVEIFDPDSLSFEYTWDFGNGVRKKTTIPKIAYSFYLERGENSKDFTVNLTVSDKKGGSATQSKKITVQKSFLKLQVLQPIISRSISRNDKTKIIAIVQDLDNQPFDLSNLNEYYAVFNGEKIELIPGIDTGMIEGFFSAKYNDYQVSLLEIFVKSKSIATNPRYKDTKEIRSLLALDLEPGEILLSNPFTNTTFSLGKTVNKIPLNLFYGDFTDLEVEGFQGSAYLDVSGLRIPVTIDEVSGSYFINSDFILEEKHINDNIKLVIWGQDLFGNLLEKNEFELFFETQSTDFQLNVSISGVLTKREFSYGQKITFNALISGNLVTDPELELVFGQTRESFRFNLESNNGTEAVYTTEVVLPLFESYPKDELDYTAIARMQTNIDKKIATKKGNLSLSNNLNISLIYPDKDAINPLLEDANKIKVKITHPNGERVEFSEITSEVSVDGKTESVTLFAIDSENSIFEGELTSSFIEGQTLLSVSIDGDYLASESINATFSIPEEVKDNQNIQFLSFVVVLLGLFAIAFYVVFFVLTTRSERIRKLKDRREHISRLLKSLRFEYYKRRISEKDYKERVLSKQEELVIVKKKLEKLEVQNKKELNIAIKKASAEKKTPVFSVFKFKIFLKKLFKPGRLKNEKPQTDVLEQKLMAFQEGERQKIRDIILELWLRTDEFSRYEVYTTLQEQNFSVPAVKFVVSILYDKGK